MLSKEFLIERGYCCRLGCVMCPYLPTHQGPKMKYKPLHTALTIKESTIQGLGVFASKAIPKETYLGITHVCNQEVGLRYFTQGVIRTPLGGFLNHSEEPNSHIEKSHDGDIWRLVTLSDIPVNQEILIKYFPDFLTF